MQGRIDFDPPSNGTATSDEAAIAIKPHAETLRRAIHEYVASRGTFGATRNEIESDLSIAGNTVRPRVLELIDQDKLIETDRTRKTPSGRNASILVALA